MKNKLESHSGVQDLCRKLAIQLDELAVVPDQTLSNEEKARRKALMEQLKKQLADLSL